MKRILITLSLAALVACQAACTSTITPKVVTARQASFDGSAQTSGLLSRDTKGATITAAARSRYNRLVAAYGKKLNPDLVADYGVIANADGTFFMNDEAFQDFIILSAWDRMAKEAAK